MPDTSPAFAFTIGELRKDPDINLRDLRDRARLHDIVVHPVVYARAKVALGLIPPKPRARRRRRDAEEESAASTAPANLRPAEPARTASPSEPGARPAMSRQPERGRSGRHPVPDGASAARVEAAIGEFLRVAAERHRYRATLLEIRELIADSQARRAGARS